ncbi:hypothetical protein QBC37DRAFT_402095, partial [Rhypophila decipiens]
DNPSMLRKVGRRNGDLPVFGEVPTIGQVGSWPGWRATAAWIYGKTGPIRRSFLNGYQQQKADHRDLSPGIDPQARTGETYAFLFDFHPIKLCTGGRSTLAISVVVEVGAAKCDSSAITQHHSPAIGSKAAQNLGVSTSDPDLRSRQVQLIRRGPRAGARVWDKLQLKLPFRGSTLHHIKIRRTSFLVGATPDCNGSYKPCRQGSLFQVPTTTRFLGLYMSMRDLVDC